MPGANASPSENLTASGKLFFYAIARAAIARALWQKNKIRNFGNVQNSDGAWHRLSLTSLSDNGRFDGW